MNLNNNTMNGEDVEEIVGAPLKYVPLREVYDATAPPPKHHTIRKCSDSDPADNRNSELRRKSKRKRFRLKIDADYKRFIGLKCKVHWPLNDDWYFGRIVGYDPVTDRHHIKYKDGDKEHLILSNERISFYVSPQEMQQLQLSYGVPCPDTNDRVIDEIIDLAATLDDSCDLDPNPGDMIWAKVTGDEGATVY